MFPMFPIRAGVSILLSLVLTAELSDRAYADSSQFIQQQAFSTPGGPFSVALSGDGRTALVGAFVGSSTGVAYVFNKKGNIWTEQILTASDGFNGLYFGYSVALSNDGRTALIGAYGKNNFAGAVYVFTYRDNTWTQQQELIASDAVAGDIFGWAVALSSDGRTALISAVFKNGSTGAAYIFTYGQNTWTQQQELVASDGGPGDNFGVSLAVNNDGHLALVGATGKNSSGAAYVFKYGPKSYTQQQELTAFDGGIYNAFGGAVALSNDGRTALIGAANKNGNGTGVAYVFRSDHNVYMLQQELVALDSAAFDAFGSSVALSNDGHTAIVGAWGKNIAAGVVYVYSYDRNSYVQRQELGASDATHGGQFGYSLSLDNDGHTAFIGSNFDSGGSVYIFAEH